jgi:hypothetical protein
MPHPVLLLLLASFLLLLFCALLARSWSCPVENSGEDAHRGATSSQAPHSRRLPGLSSRLPCLVGWRASICTPLARGEKPPGSPPSASTPRGSLVPTKSRLYFGITDANIHAASRRWQAWPGRAHPNLSRSRLPRHVQCSAPYSVVSPENPLTPGRHGAVGDFPKGWILARLNASSAIVRRRSPRGLPVQAGMLRAYTSASSPISTFPTCTWMHCAPGCAAPIRFVFLWLAIDPLTKILPVLSSSSPHAAHGTSGHPHAPREPGLWLSSALYQ